ncbi:hypothetical protein HYFRA_00001856 [Hymenoscyphus fraxineus]|uniref:DUF924-domain-containing protein n=1 Tax=Hymenoscyphus fraxineus TaxID=746836 RepID=A0A9N9KML2_9HELO|nr:hypothetical protein HYFRA_00001856 [Hymenoscyphus fraxineus]
MRPFNLTSSLSKVLGLQAIFKSAFNPSHRAMSTIPTPQPEIDRVIKYWFEADDVPQKWFRGGPKVDSEIKDQFSALVSQARAAELTPWTADPKGTLALIILLDQFTRNIFRGSPESYSKDKLGLGIAADAIAKGFDRQVPVMQQVFFYLPLMHDENLVSQIAGMALCEGLVERCVGEEMMKDFAEKSIKSAQSHMDCIRRFGRFPSRNEVLGRESTVGEIEYLEKEHSGW